MNTMRAVREGRIYISIAAEVGGRSLQHEDITDVEKALKPTGG